MAVVPYDILCHGQFNYYDLKTKTAQKCIPAINSTSPSDSIILFEVLLMFTFS